jgi:hypothetical protein
MKLIYVFDEAAKSKLLEAGFVLLKEDLKGSVYIFHYDEVLKDACAGLEYVISDVLSF